MADNPVGRPSVITPEIINKLEEAFANGANDLQACFYAGISKSAFYAYQDAHPEFKERKDGLKNHLQLIAKNVLAKSIRSGNENDAKWLLERKEKGEYSLRNELTGADGKEFKVNWPLPQTELDAIPAEGSVSSVSHEEPKVGSTCLPPSCR